MCLKLTITLSSVELDIPLRMDGKGCLDILIHSLFFKIYQCVFMKSISGLISYHMQYISLAFHLHRLTLKATDDFWFMQLL